MRAASTPMKISAAINPTTSASEPIASAGGLTSRGAYERGPGRQMTRPAPAEQAASLWSEGLRRGRRRRGRTAAARRDERDSKREQWDPTEDEEPDREVREHAEHRDERGQSTREGLGRLPA